MTCGEPCRVVISRRRPDRRTRRLSCCGCGINFVGKRAMWVNATRHLGVLRPYCTFKCCMAAKTRVGTEVSLIRSWAERAARLRARTPCTVCGVLASRARCSDKCEGMHKRSVAAAKWQPVPQTWHVCEQEGCSVLVHGKQKHYCMACIKVRERTQARQRRRGHSESTRSRCRHFGVLYDCTVTRRAVLERDSMMCCCCGCVVVDGGGDSAVADYAEIDHIIPLSAKMLGHTWDNVQTLCRRCNADKSTGMPLQWEDDHPLWVMVQTQ